MQPVAHILEYYRTKLAGADAADWPHIRLREIVIKLTERNKTNQNNNP